MERQNIYNDPNEEYKIYSALKYFRSLSNQFKNEIFFIPKVQNFQTHFIITSGKKVSGWNFRVSSGCNAKKEHDRLMDVKFYCAPRVRRIVAARVSLETSFGGLKCQKTEILKARKNHKQNGTIRRHAIYSPKKQTNSV